jgi:alanine racemase
MDDALRHRIDAAGAPVLTVDTRALAANWRLLAARATPAACAAVVKANAYGTGIEITVPGLRAAGCTTFFVAHLSEARRARAVAPDATVYVLHGLPPGAAPLYRAIDIRPVLGSRAEIDEWLRDGAGAPYALHVDTGMNRLGLRVDEALALAPTLKPALLISHFVSSEVSGDPTIAHQIAAFERLRAAFPGTPGSLANSSGIFLDPLPHHDLVRPGYALYGGNPTPGRPNPMRPVVTLEAPVVTVRDVPAGETVGYNGQWTARGGRRIAVVSTGYADAIDRRATATDTLPGGEAIVAGRRCPLAGRVSMDLITIDVSDLPDGAVRRGDRATLIGGELDIDRVATQMGTIGYEILTRLAARLDRRATEG